MCVYPTAKLQNMRGKKWTELKGETDKSRNMTGNVTSKFHN